VRERERERERERRETKNDERKRAIKREHCPLPLLPPFFFPFPPLCPCPTTAAEKSFK
jgi:hypothetical protein